ncbi:MAG: choice-of-anchor L domain-containing protein [Nannocystaceae bacterium]
MSKLRGRFPAAACGALALLGSTACPGPEGGGIDFTGASTTANSPTTAASSSSGPADGSTGGGCLSDADCAGDPAGEVCELATGSCTTACEPGQTRPCYSGPEPTEGVGACVAGTNACDADGRWSLFCDGEVVPTSETCDDGVDQDCDGRVDDSDADGDGFGACSGDCCDGGACTDAQLVNPGAFEVVGNELDDDCDGLIDEPPQTCDAGLSSSSGDALDYAAALELCQTTEAEPAEPQDRTWGVIEASLTRADGSGAPLPVQRSLRPGFGNLVGRQEGDRMVVLSTGHAADADDSDPAYAPFEPGQSLGTVASVPADWLAANGGVMPNPAGCLEPWNTNANDSAMLTVRVRAPTNASSFSVKMFFLSAEYPEWVCSEFNDFFVTLVDSSADNPDDKNIAIYDDDGTSWPVGVNLVMVADGLFTQCDNGQVGCARDLGADYLGCVGDALLDGTGFDANDPETCEASQTLAGGGTGWLRMSGNVTPGETFEVRFAIWDTSGSIYDSVVLLDDWRWSLEAAEPGVAPG